MLAYFYVIDGFIIYSEKLAGITALDEEDQKSKSGYILFRASYKLFESNF